VTPETSARELTVLAWRRTALRWVVVAVVGARLFYDALGGVVVAAALFAILVAAGLSIHVTREFGGPDAPHSPVPRLAVLVVGTALVGLVALWWVLAR
jgi:hypothetical protein